MRGGVGFRAALVTTTALFAGYFALLGVSLFTAGPSGELISRLLSADTGRSLLLSLTGAALASALALLAALPVAYTLSRFRFPGRDLLDGLVDLPVVLSPVALGVALLILLSRGPLSGGGRFITFAFPGVVLAQFTVVSALAVRLLKASFDKAGARPEEVARTLGATRFQAFFEVALPSVRHGLAAALVLCFARAMGEFGATVTLAGMSHRVETLPVGIGLGLAGGDIAGAAALAVLLLVSSLAVLVGFRYAARRSGAW